MRVVDADDCAPTTDHRPSIFAHADKTIRTEACNLSVELHTWIGRAVDAAVKDIKPMLLTEYTEACKASGGKHKPTRQVRSKQGGDAPATPAPGAPEGAAAQPPDDPMAEYGDAPEVAWEDLEAVKVEIPATFDSEIKEAKWSTRKEALAGLFKVLNKPRVQPSSQFADVVRTCSAVVSKDSNVLNVALAANCLGVLAAGLHAEFSAYTVAVTSTLFEKFKEKKVNVVTALQGALERVIPTATLDKLTGVFEKALKHKNPAVRQNVAIAIAAHLQTKPKGIDKPTIKQLFEMGAAALGDGTPVVRDEAVAVLAALVAAAGDKVCTPLINGLDKAKAEKVRAARAALNADSGGGGGSAPAAAAEPAAAAATKTKAAPKSKAKAKASKPAATAAAVSTTSTKRSTSSGPRSTSVSAPSGANLDLEAAKTVAEALGITEATYALLHTDGNATSWKERLEGAKAMLAILEQAEELTPQDVLAVARIAQSSTKKWKESNFQVYSHILNCVTAASKACPDFPERVAHICVVGIVEKLGDSKVKKHGMACLDAMSECWSVNDVSLLVCKHAGAHKNPKVIQGGLEWMANATDAFGFRLAIKPHVAFAKAQKEAKSPIVRTAAIAFLTTLRVHIGPSFEKVCTSNGLSLESDFAKVEGKSAPAPTLSERSSAGAGDEAGGEDGADRDEGSAEVAASAAEAAAEEMIDRVEIMTVIKAATISELEDKAWKVRAQALVDVADGMKKAPFLKPYLGDLGTALVARLHDSNKNIIITSLGLLGELATSVGPNIKSSSKAVLPTIYETLADGKDQVRAAALAAMGAWHAETGLGPFVEGDIVPVALKAGKPHETVELLKFITENFVKESKVSLKALVKPLFVCIGDRTKEVRNAAKDLLPAMVASVGADKMKKACTSQLSGSEQTKTIELIAALRKSAPAKAKAPQAAAVDEESSATTSSSAASKGAGEATRTTRKTTAKAKTTKAKSEKASGAAKAKSESSLILDEKGYVKRHKDEKSNKTLKWNFTTPRQEFVTQLQQQFEGTVSGQLQSWLFDKDFKAHIKVLDILIAGVTTPDDGETAAPLADEALCSIDLLLKWTTLRFFDTNPAVHRKTMQFLQELFNTLAVEGGEFADQDAHAFLPYLMTQSGHKLESVRQDTHQICRTICKTYSTSKMFMYLLEGLKSKNSKQRTECLLESGYLIQTVGMSVCQYGPAKALKAIAAQIADRDNGVRSAALDCVVEVYNHLGEDVYKLIGAIGDKNTSLVQERIKRHGKKQGAAPAPVAAASSGRGGSVPEKKLKGKGAKKKAPQTPEQSNIPQQFSLEFGSDDSVPVLDLDALGLAPTELEDDTELVGEDGAEDGAAAEPLSPAPKMPAMSAAEAFIAGHGAPNTPTVVAAPSYLSPSPSPQKGFVRQTTYELPEANSTISEFDGVVMKIADMLPSTAIAALKRAEETFKATPAVLIPRADQVLNSCTAQLELLFRVHLGDADLEKVTEAVRLCKHLLGFVLQIFKSDAFSSAASPTSLQSTVVALLKHVQDTKLEKLQEGKQVTRALNCIILKILQSVEPNLALEMLLNIFGACLNGAGDPSDSTMILLVQRCLWKLVKALPDTIERVQMGPLLLGIQKFFDTAEAVVTADPEGVAVRTVRPIVHALVRLKGREVADTLFTATGDASYDSFVGGLVLQALSQEGLAVPKPAAEASVPNLSPDEQEEALVEIFAMITRKEETKQGMVKLYEFQEKYPDVDTEKYLSATSPFFQNHIKRSLADIRRRKQDEKAGRGSPKRQARSTGAGADPASAASYMSRLNALKSKGEGANAAQRDPLMRIQSQQADLAATMSAPAKPIELSAVNRSPPRAKVSDSSSIDALKARLARFKAK